MGVYLLDHYWVYTYRGVLGGGQKRMSRPVFCSALLGSFLRVEVRGKFFEIRQREARLKHWSRPKKETLVHGDFDRLRKLSQSRDRPAGVGLDISQIAKNRAKKKGGI
jgi:hypothetical protein